MEEIREVEAPCPLVESAIRPNEIYKSLMQGGFSQDEALALISNMTKKPDWDNQENDSFELRSFEKH